LLHLPLALAAIGLLTLGAGWLAEGYAGREFTLGERLLSQPRALLDYAWLALVPQRDGLGVFHDDFATSHGPFEPWTTLPALVVLGLALGAAVRFRREQPLAAFGIAWFLANHLLESTVLPLELYFEHRNYLALAGLLTLPALAVLVLRRGRWARPALALGTLWSFAVAWQGHAEARSWGDPLGQAERWSAEHPGSLRAQSYLANLRKVRGDLVGAAAAYRDHDASFADGVSFTLDWLELGCEAEPLPLPSRELVIERARGARFSFGPSAAIDRILARFERGRPCPRVALDDLAAATAALLGNPAYQREAYLLHLLDARIARLQGDRPAALAAMRRAFDGRPEADYALVEAAWWLEAGDPERAAEALERAAAAVGPNPLRQDALAPRFEALRKAVADRRAEQRIPKED
jgi:tetratricopeptide (TPR) repeat protein